MVKKGEIMKKFFFVFIFLSFFAFSQIGNKKFSLNFYFNSEWGVHLNNPSKLMKGYNSVDIKGDYDFNDNISLFFNLKKFYDSVYDIAGEYKNGSYKTATNTGNTWLREVFVDFDYSPLFVRLGRQQVVWGTADGVRVLDCINPGDSRYAYLDDASEYRIPLWMARIEYSPIEDGNLQLLLIPDYEPNYSSSYGDVFVYRVVNRPPAPFPIYENRPNDTFSHGSYAARWHYVINGWEYSLNYKYGYEFYPSVSVTPPPTITIIKEYQKVKLIGASFSKSINEGLLKGLTVRGEFLYTKDKPFPVGSDGKASGNTTMNTFAYILGLDKYFFTDMLTSFQFIQFIYPDDKKSGQSVLFPATLSPLDKVETMATLKVSKDFMSERLKPEILIVYDGKGDWRFSPKVKFEVNDNLWVYAGIHYFTGKGNTLYGEFESSSMIYAGATLSF